MELKVQQFLFVWNGCLDWWKVNIFFAAIFTVNLVSGCLN